MRLATLVEMIIAIRIIGLLSSDIRKDLVDRDSKVITCIPVIRHYDVR